MTRFFFALICLVVFLNAGCASVSHDVDYGYIPTVPYDEALKKWTLNDKAYSGGYESLEVTATLLSREIAEQQVYNDARIYHWTPDEYRDHRQKSLYDNESATSFFVVFYTYKDETNNLDKKDSKWNVFLDTGGARVIPSSIKRVYDNQSVIQNRYPHANVWSRNYLVTFPVATSHVTAGDSELTFAGDVGAVHLKFPQ